MILLLIYYSPPNTIENIQDCEIKYNRIRVKTESLNNLHNILKTLQRWRPDPLKIKDASLMLNQCLFFCRDRPVINPG